MILAESITTAELPDAANYGQIVSEASELLSRVIFDKEITPESIADSIKRAHAFLAIDGNANVRGACVMYLCDPRTAYISHLGVHEDFRDQKLGSRLIDAAETAATEYDCDLMQLLIVDGSVAQPFYEKLGFTVTYAADDGIRVAEKILGR